MKELPWWEKVSALQEWNCFYQSPASPTEPFFGVNYLNDACQLSRLQESARHGQIVPVQVDLRQQEGVESIIKQVTARGMPLALVDLSNAWDWEFPNNYMGRVKTAGLLAQLDAVVTDDTILLLTRGVPDHTPKRTYYHAYRFSAYRNMTKEIYSWSGRELTGEDFINTVEWNSRQHNTFVQCTRMEQGYSPRYGVFFGDDCKWRAEYAG